MTISVGNIFVNDATRGTSVEFSKEFFERPLPEQAAIISSVFINMQDEFINVYEDVVESIQGDNDALKVALEIAA